MSIFDISLLVAAVLAAGVSARFSNWRGIGWILVGAASFVASTIYWRSGLPYAPVFTGLCDAMVCLAIYLNYRQRWEVGVYALFLVSVMVSLLHQGGQIGSQEVYSIALEAINYLALIWISATPILMEFGSHGRTRRARGVAGRLAGIGRALAASRERGTFAERW